ncbi:MAG: aldehyde ferredoxin oxidoreductase C-terminal domain-containing protein [Dethiobacteria bacterium]|jgi:aldehyde:ferredoxin oxidoreductase
MNKFLRVDMRNQSTKIEEAPAKYQFMGGRRLISQLLLDEVDPTCEPLGRHNKLVIAPGLLGGTPAPCSGRLSVGGKSPLTGGIKESNSGGTAAAKLARLGYKAVIVEDQPQEGWYILKINKDGATFLNGENLLGLDSYEACKRLREEHGEKIGIIIIGVAGERQYRLATCAVADPEGDPARHAARGGMGAVMGSKKLKAILVDDSGADDLQYADRDAFLATSREWAKELAATKTVMTELGTANLVLTTSALGCLPTRNFSSGSFEKAENISGQRMRKVIQERGGKTAHNCQRGCPIRCSNVYVDEEGNHLTSSLEYETLALMGSNLGIDDLDAIAKIDRFCDGFGVDTMELGDAVGVAMEAGIVPFGDVDGVMNLLQQLKEGTVTGRVLAQGTEIAGKVLGVRRVPVVKGQGISAYDPRALKGTGVTYATSPMGADHTAGNCLPGRTGYRELTKESPDPCSAERQIEMSQDLQILTAVCDYAGLCFFVGAALPTAKRVAKLLRDRFGKEFSVNEVLEIAKDCIMTEVEFNRRAGITEADNRLPEFFSEEELPPTGSKFDIDNKDLQTIFDNLSVEVEI